jgi:predicted TIM-barrel fold metal-dependent hydrolase
MAGYTGPLVDVDIHNAPKSSKDIIARMPKRWADYLDIYPPTTPDSQLVRNMFRRGDTWGPNGEFPGTSYEVLRDQLLDPYNVYRGILTHDIGHYPGLTNQYFAKDVCRAANEWLREEWLDRDDRLYGLVVVPHSLPQESAAEVRHWADDSQVVGLLFASNPLGRPLGDPIYHPIYEAASECNMTIGVHQEPDRRQAGGAVQITSQLMYGSRAQTAMHYVSSLIVHGVFEKFPNLKFVIKEYGISWLPWLMWRLDQEYELLKRETPWVKRLPSEYIRDHIKVSTQPIETGARNSDVATYMSSVEGIEDLLCFSTDYPHGTMDDPLYAARIFPNEWHRKIFCDNACRSYGWTPPVEAPAAVA